MSGWLGLLWLFFLSAVAAWAASAAAAVVLARVPAHAERRPAVRARRALMLALLPWIFPLTSVAAILLLAAAKSWGIVADHCLYHGPGHPHLCLQHLPAIPFGHWHLLGLAAALAMVILLLACYLVNERRALTRLRSMRRLAHGFGRMRVLEIDQCFAITANRRNPFILISRGLIERLTRRERRIVVAHEVAHLRHRDLLRNFVFDLLLLAHLPWSAKPLRRAWRQALEERADDRVAAIYGREAVAQALIKVLRASPHHECKWSPAMSVAGADPLRRIKRLLSADEGAVPSPAFEVLYVAVLVAVAAALPAAHHLLETFLGFLTRG